MKHTSYSILFEISEQKELLPNNSAELIYSRLFMN